jgi:hypothetical protein
MMKVLTSLHPHKQHLPTRIINNDLVLGAKDGTKGNADTTTMMMVTVMATMTAASTTTTTPTI